MSFFHLPRAEPQHQQEYPVTTETEETGQFYDGAPVPVHIASTDASPVKEVAPEFGSCMTYTIPQQGQNPAIQVLPRRIHRVKAQLTLRGGASTTTIWLNTSPNLIDSPAPVGFRYRSGASGNFQLPDWLAQQPLYVISSDAPDGLLSVMDSSYGED